MEMSVDEEGKHEM